MKSLDDEGRLYTPVNEFQAIPGYRERAMSPGVISRETGNLLGLYFSEQMAIPNFAIGRQYLAKNTLDYIWAAEKGFYTLYDKRAHTEPGELKVFLDDSKAALNYPDTEQNEAFGHSVVIFSVLPEMGEHPSFPTGLRNMLRPPETPMEFLLRLKELRAEIIKIIGGQTTPQTPLETTNSLLRSYMYFWTAREIPFKCPEDKHEMEERARHSLNKLLGDIQISLD
ncbi:MAG: hypothetical protein M1524_00540 [Patescibacteria group bacterium]|nr:hypothetical protein [Patescibacteria group bacterium]